MSTFSIKIKPILLLCTLVVTLMISGYCETIEKPNIVRPRYLNIREFGYDESTLKYYRRRAMLLDATTMRVAPEGPDPQHHSISPTMS
ncbi:unnamed protein product [Withania somnifera]